MAVENRQLDAEMMLGNKRADAIDYDTARDLSENVEDAFTAALDEALPIKFAEMNKGATITVSK